MTMNTRTTRLATAAIGAILLASGVVGSATARSDLQTAKAATARFHDLSVAGHAGFGQPPAPAPLHFCISSLNNTGAMGFHFINGANLDKVLDPSRPEVLVYAPDTHGRLKLAALEYVIFQSAWYEDHAQGTMPMLFGQDFMPNDGSRFEIPPFFALHVWLFQDNPSGMFAPFNPNVTCDNAAASTRSSNTAARSLAALTAATAPRALCRVPTATA
jgi:hypothetical protein